MLLWDTIVPLLAFSTVVAEAQGINFGKVLQKKPALSKAKNPKPTATVGVKQNAASIVKQMKKIKPTATPGAKSPKVLAADLACVKEDVQYGYVPSPNNPNGFLVDTALSGIAKVAKSYPANYVTSFTNEYGSLFNNAYLGYYQLPTYNTSACAAICDGVSACAGFNIYFERNPIIKPGADCRNPAAATSVRCALWGNAVNATQAKNIGQWRTDFMVVIQGSNGYNKNPTPATVSGFKAPVALSGAVDASALTTTPFLRAEFYNQAFNPQLCADLCTSTTAANKKAATGTTYTSCNYFNVLDLSLNGASQGTYCQLYSADVSKNVGLYSATYAGVSYDLLRSYGYAVVSVDSASTSSTTSTTTTTTSLATSSPIPTTPASAADVVFVSATTAWTGSTTSTKTIFAGPTATILVMTPGLRSTTAATSTTTVSVDLGTDPTIVTTTIAPTVAGGPATVRVAYPTAVQTCGNSGIAFAAYNNPYNFKVGAYVEGYSNYNPETFRTAKPILNGTTTYIAASGVNVWGADWNVYGTPNVKQDSLALDHVFYIYANQDGYYSFNLPRVDDIELIWLGPKALTGWTRSNADLEQLYKYDWASVQPKTKTVRLYIGDYLPVRVQWGDYGGDAYLTLAVYGPDGGKILYSEEGANTGYSSKNVVQFPCDPSKGAKFPAWAV
ncbi:hypothetical protein CAC42_1723 [Sphaceloma murrayae]|uniref:PA14 domain-containing protein n=1 Tax=Sphaceloma murrayae TaxID=2082308 RepID=A0A2K1QIC8_9PEZI|nr:hypothetical protein CAC42_1723 [Sphaceloma murrayae]